MNCGWVVALKGGGGGVKRR